MTKDTGRRTCNFIPGHSRARGALTLRPANVFHADSLTLPGAWCVAKGAGSGLSNRDGRSPLRLV
jgi:hypothetical protein